MKVIEKKIEEKNKSKAAGEMQRSWRWQLNSIASQFHACFIVVNDEEYSLIFFFFFGEGGGRG